MDHFLKKWYKRGLKRWSKQRILMVLVSIAVLASAMATFNYDPHHTIHAGNLTLPALSTLLPVCIAMLCLTLMLLHWLFDEEMAHLISGPIIFVTCVLLCWVMVHLPKATQAATPNGPTQLANLHDVQSFTRKHMPNATLIPTGMAITHIAHQSAKHSYKITAFIWQQFPDDMTLPNMPDIQWSDNTQLTQSQLLSTSHHEGFHLATWKATIDIKHAEKLTEYPFDQTTLKISMLPKNMQNNTQLIPALNNYPRHAHPGINQNISLSDQSIDGSYFSFEKNALGSNLNLPRTTYAMPYELTLNVKMTRLSTQALVAYVLPLIIVILLCYASFLIMSYNPDGNIGNKMPLAATFVFILVLIQSQYHRDFGIYHFTYLDAIMAYSYVVIAALVAAMIWHDRHNLLGENPTPLVKRLAAWFWPTNGIILLTITAMFFVGQ